MSQPNVGSQFGSVLLRLRVALLRANPLTLAAAGLLVAVLAGFAWLLHAIGALEAARDASVAPAARALVVNSAPAPAPQAAPDNLAQFYAALGQRRHAEQQVKTLFGLAAQNGLTLAQGEYKTGYDRNTQVYTYQVKLPVKGSYAAIWKFALGALRAIPFASLDDIGFRRDSIGDPQVEARLRLTFYLADGGTGALR